MFDLSKQKILKEKIDAHLRKTARRMVQFDTLDETLNYLIDSFRKQFACDYMSIITIQDQMLATKVKKGDSLHFDSCFPISTEDCMPRILTEPLCSFDVIQGKEHCALLTCLEKEQFQTWFTIPIHHEDDSSLGLCVIGFRSFVPLVMDAGKMFEEYGKDIATAFVLARQKENEHRKITGMEWLKENAYLGGSSLSQIVGNIVERAGKGTSATSAYIYLYDEKNNCLILQSPIYGEEHPVERVALHKGYDLKPFFPYLEKAGGTEITIPLIVNVKMIGVLHVIKGKDSFFSADHLELLQFLASHVSALIENARLYMSEKDSNFRMETFMQHQQELVKHTLEDEGFARISEFLSNMMNCSILLFDRFFHLTSEWFRPGDEQLREPILQTIQRERRDIRTNRLTEIWLTENDHPPIGLWRVTATGDTLGYLGIVLPKDRLDIVLRMTLNHALNVYAVQFIKQKLVLDVREQVKDSFFNQLFVEKLEDKGKILEYANLLNWNISEPHSIGLFAFEFDKTKEQHQSANLLEEDAKKTWLWERIRDYISRREPGILFTRKDGYYMAIVPQQKSSNEFWKAFYQRILKLLQTETGHISVYIGISQESRQIEDYYLCYKQAQKTLAILCSRFPDKGYMLFNQLGSYSVLYHLGDPMVVPLFLKTYLDPLLQYGKNRDLFDTLRVYLLTNGNITETSNALYIHRSSLKYRLDKIRQLMDMDIDNAEERFNLMLAYKLFDLFGEKGG